MSTVEHKAQPPDTGVRIRHLTIPELAHGWSLCGLPRGDRPLLVNGLKPSDELCVVCAVEYERLRGFPWHDRQQGER